MKLYLVRHATASDSAPSDADRRLTREGEAEARVIGKALAKLGVKPDAIAASPLLRARETAAIIGSALGDGEVEIVEELENGPSTTALIRGLKAHAGARELILVGHMPSLAEHLAEFLGVKNTQGFPLGKGTVVCLEMDLLCEGAGQLRWWMRQKQLELIAG